MAKTYNNFADIITFSRTSNATVRDSDGYIKWAGHNVISDSEDFSDASWNSIDITIAANDETAPDGTDTADKITSDSTTSTLYHAYPDVLTGFNYKHVCFFKYIDHQWIRFGGYGSGDSTPYAAYFDIQNGVVGTVGSSTTATIEDVGSGWYKCTIESEIQSTSQNLVITLANADNSLVETSGASVYAWGAHIYNSQYLDMVQNPANTWTGGGSYYKTGTSGGYFAPRIEHDPDGNVKGLLIEEERENLYGHHIINFATNNVTENQNDSGTLDPAGKNNSTLFREDSSNDVHRYYGASVLVENPLGTYKTAHSVYAKEDTNYAKRYLVMTPTGQSPDNYAVFNLSGDGSVTQTGSSMDDAYIEKAGNGWYRCTVATNGDGTPTTGMIFALSTTSTPNSYQPSYQGNGESGLWLWGYQVESIHNSGGVARHTNVSTSYIPTKSGTAYARSIDDVQLNASDLGYNLKEGTFYFEVYKPQASEAGYNTIFHAGNGGTDDRIWINLDFARKVRFDVKVDATLQLDPLQSTPLTFDGTIAKIAMAYKKDNFAMSVNGATAITDTSGSLDTLYLHDLFTIGRYRNTTNSGAYPYNGTIKNIKYYPRRLTDDQLEDLTS